MTCINIDIIQSSCNKIIITDYSEYDLTKGPITSKIVKILVPGQTKIIEVDFNINSTTILDCKNLNIQRITTDPVKDLLEGLYELNIEVTQVKDGITTTSFQTICHFNMCSIDCSISKLKLDILSNKCCDDNDCSNKLKDSYKFLNELELYRDGIKASSELCNKETVKELYKCLKTKLSLSDVQCKCK